jgi:two-component system NarL family response regulator
MLDQEDDFEIVGMAEDGRVALDMVSELSPDVVLMDIGMPDLNGMEATRQITRRNPGAKVVALSTHASQKHVRAMLEAGAAGYVTKDAATAELTGAIRKVRKGEKYLCSTVTGFVVDSFVHGDNGGPGAMRELGSREVEVLQLIAEGMTSGEIAQRLHISTNTVDTHRRNIMKKLDLHSVADLTKYAVREGLVELEC